MTTISLQKYHEQINQLLDDNQYSLAADHCRYILRQHPRHVDTYRLLARTLIEQGDLSGATELFQRVLSAEPNDFIAHAGLSVVYREEEVLSQAIWHLERAYEIEPYNGAIQQELRGLYIDYSEQKAREKQDEYVVDVPDSLPLTKGALARIYIQGELYTQAIEILRKALEEEEERIDLEVLLAEALWRDNQRVTAVQVCLQVLDKLPNCITANAVLAEIWLRTGRTEEAQDYLQELQALTLLDVSYQDLESPAGSAFQPEGAFALPDVFEVERMGDDELDSIEMVGVGDSVVDTSDTDDYQWLEGLGDELAVIDEDEPADEPTTITDSDWLRRELESGELSEETAVSDLLSSDWLADLADEDDTDDDGLGILGVVAAGAAAGAIADHLQDDEETTSPTEDDSFDWLNAELAESDELTPLDVSDIDDDIDWLSEEIAADHMPDDDETIFAQTDKAEEAEVMPDWLADMDEDELEPVQVDPSEATIIIEDNETDDDIAFDTNEDDDIYGWLDDVSTGEPADELTDGDLDLSQFAEFGGEDLAPEKDENEEIVWRLTDELNAPEDENEPEIEELGEFDFEISPDESDELEDVPDWLMASGSLDEMEAVSPTEEASNEIADELAEWVAANQPEMDDSEEFPDWLSEVEDEDEPSEISQELPAEELAPEEPVIDKEIEGEEEDDFFTSDLPGWMVESNMEFAESTPLDSAPLDLVDDAAADSTPLSDADLPDWLLAGGSDLDDSGLLFETGDLDVDATDPEIPVSGVDEDGDLPDWLVDESELDETEPASPVVDESDLLDWLSEDADEEIEETKEDDRSGTAVVGGMLGAAAAGILAKEILDNDDDNEDEQPVQLEQTSGLDDVVTEDAVSNMQDDDLIFPQDESEPPLDDSGDFDWLDDLDASSAKSEADSLSLDDLSDDMGDDLDWMNLDDESSTDDLNLDSLLGLEPEEEAAASVEEEKPEESVPAGLAEDESLDWLDALADTESEAVDEMPTWKWDEDEDSIPMSVTDEAIAEPDTEEPELEPAVETAVTDDMVEDLDDAMSWLEDLAAEPDAPVEELPSVAEDMDFDSMFESDPELDTMMDLSVDSEPSEDLDEIFAADTQNDSWLDGLAESDAEDLPDFLEEESEFDLDGFLEADLEETAVAELGDSEAEPAQDAGEPPEDLDGAMAWLEKLAANQGAPLDELPSIDQEQAEAEEETDEDGFDLVKGAAAVAAGAAAVSALSDSDEEDTAAIDDLPAEESAIEQTLIEDELMAMDVPEDPDEAMAWLEKLAAKQGAPLDELPSVSEDDLLEEGSTDEIFADFEESEQALDDLFEDTEEATLLMDTDVNLFVESESDDMAWLEGLEDETEAAAEPAKSDGSEFGDLSEFDFSDPVPPEEAEEEVDPLLAELDWLESVTASPETETTYNAEELSVSDDDLSDALEKLSLLAVGGTVTAAVLADDDDEEEDEGEEIIETETAVSESELISEDISAESIVDEMPEDPDEAMAWLEKLAARQGAPLDELPSVAEDEYDDLAAEGTGLLEDLEGDLSVDDADLTEEESLVADDLLASPEEMDVEDAMAWLEQLAARQGTSLDELPTVEDVPEDVEDINTPEWIAQQTESLDQASLETELAESADVEEPTSTDDSLAELMELDSADETAPVDEMTIDPGDMDIDDAMAWMEQLAARQGTSLDELPTVKDSPISSDDIDTPEWIAKQTGPLDQASLELKMAEVESESLDEIANDDFFAALDEVPAIEGIETEAKQADPSLTDIDDSMPDWLDGGEDDSPLGHTGWLNTVEEPDMDGWLASEAEVSTIADSTDSLPKAVETDSLLSTGGLEDTGDLSGEASKPDTGELRLPGDASTDSYFTAELDEAQVLADLDLGDLGIGLDRTQLEAARNSLAGGDVDSALSEYQSLVEAGEEMHTVISDLERAAELHRDQPMVRRMLGDAYMRNGQINKAIETYRDALDQM